jgi:peptidoglycan/LPS O-acetylase OafA/YrhL
LTVDFDASAAAGRVPAPPLHLPGLNGLRAFAAVAVVVSHLRLNLPAFGMPARPGLLLAQYGVTMFFALSGFLITYLLMKERAAAGRIDVRRFYLRRILRIWPLYYLYLAAAVLAVWATAPEALPGSLALYVLLLPNLAFMFNRSLPMLDHYWSLGVEEQFYAVWPLVLARLHRPVIALVRFVTIFLIAKAAAGYAKYRYGIDLPWLTLGVNRFDCMMLGAIGGILAFEDDRRFMRLYRHPLAQLLAWLVLALITLNHFDVHPLVNHEVVAAASTVAILNLAFNPRSLVSLDYPLFDFVGKISFGIYVYHPLVFAALARLRPKAAGNALPDIASELGLYAVVVALTTVIAWISYVVLERPFLRLKERYAIVVTSAAA